MMQVVITCSVSFEAFNEKLLSDYLMEAALMILPTMRLKI